MQLNLKRPLLVFDVEATGTHIVNDRIVEISAIKIMPDQQQISKSYRLNPTIPISEEAQAIHGISDEDVKDLPTFADVAKEIYDFFEPCDLCGYNANRLDIPLLLEEFLRLEMYFDLNNRKLVDVQRIFHMMEKRTLAAAYKFYCDKDLDDSHSAIADAIATFEVLEAQLDKYENLENQVDFLHTFSKEADYIDTGRRLIMKNGKPAFNFGKYRGQLVGDVLSKDPGYYSWIQKNEFPLHTKQKLKEIKLSLSFKA